jgi:hypothetical protein
MRDVQRTAEVVTGRAFGECYPTHMYRNISRSFFAILFAIAGCSALVDEPTSADDTDELAAEAARPLCAPTFSARILTAPASLEAARKVAEKACSRNGRFCTLGGSTDPNAPAGFDVSCRARTRYDARSVATALFGSLQDGQNLEQEARGPWRSVSDDVAPQVRTRAELVAQTLVTADYLAAIERSIGISTAAGRRSLTAYEWLVQTSCHNCTSFATIQILVWSTPRRAFVVQGTYGWDS